MRSTSCERAVRPQRAKEIERKKKEWRAGLDGKKEEAKDKEKEREKKKRERLVLEKREKEKREGRTVDGLDIVSAESSSIKSNYDVIDRGPVGRGRGDVGGEAKSSEWRT